MAEKVKVADLEAILNLLQNDETRARVVNQLRLKNVDVSSKMLIWASQYFERQGELASEWHEKQRSLETAARLAQEANVFDRAIELYIKSEMHFETTVVNLVKHVEQLDIIFEIFKKQKNLYGMINCADKAEELGFFEHAFRYSSEGGVYRKAAKIAIKNGWAEKAADMIDKMECEKDFLEAAKYAAETGLMDRVEGLSTKAIEKLVQEKQYHEAGLAAEKAGMMDKAKQLYGKASEEFEKQGIFDYAASLAQQAGMGDKAKELFQKAMEKEETMGYENHFERAGEYAEKAGLKEKAKEFYTKAMERNLENGRLTDAARNAKKAGLEEKAQELCPRAINGLEEKKLFCQAAELAEEIGFQEKADELYKKAIANAEEEMAFGHAGFVAEKLGLVEKSKAYRRLNEVLGEYSGR